MTDDAPNGEGHLTQPEPEPKPTPALLISPESLTFSAGDVSTNLTLDQVMQAAIKSKNPVGLLLYGVILKVNVSVHRKSNESGRMSKACFLVRNDYWAR